MGTRRGSAKLVLPGCLLLVVGLAGVVCTLRLFGSLEESVLYTLEKAHGVPEETNPDGSIRVARAEIVLDEGAADEVRLEKRTYYDQQGNLAREVIRTPTREIVYEGGHPPRLVRDERTLIGRWGVRPPFGPYQWLAYAACAAGVALIAAGVFVRWRGRVSQTGAL